MKILLTAPPKTGKSTLIKKLIEGYKGNKYGILAEEVRDSNQQRTGFDAVRLDGQRKPFMQVSSQQTDYRVGDKYNVDVGVVDDFMSKAIIEGLEKRDGMIFIDEIGRAEAFSPFFLHNVREALDSDLNVIGTIVYDDEPWSMEFKNHPGVMLFEINEVNRDLMAEWILRSINGEDSEINFK